MSNPKITRRRFLEVAGGTLAVASAPGYLKILASSVTSSLKTRRKLGRTDLLLTPVGFGAQRTNDPDLIRYALDCGINHVETSWAYGMGKPGNNCECVGKAIQGKRDSICLTVAYLPVKNTGHLTVQKQFEDSLRDLGTDHIDIFLWKQPEGIGAITPEHIEYLQKLKS